MSLLKALSKEERTAMTADQFMEEIIKQIAAVDGPILIRTVYESRDNTQDLWLQVVPIMVDKAESERIASDIQTDGVVH